MGKEYEAQVLGARLGMAAIALLAVVVAITIAVMVGGHLRSVMPESPASPGGAPVGAVEYPIGE